MAFTDYTTPGSVRAVLGVSAKEAKDEVITDPVYLTQLLEKLDELGEEIGATFVTDYRTALDAEPRSDLQGRLVLAVQTYCAHVIALALIPVLPVMAPQRITDGTAEKERVDNPYENMREPIAQSLAYIKLRLKTTYAKMTGTGAPRAAARTHVIGSTLGVDPVTG